MSRSDPSNRATRDSKRAEIRNARTARRTILLGTVILCAALIAYEKWLALPVVLSFAAFGWGLCTLSLKASEAAASQESEGTKPDSNPVN